MILVKSDMSLSNIDGKYTSITPQRLAFMLKERANLMVEVTFIDNNDSYMIKIGTISKSHEFFVKKKTLMELDGDVGAFLCNLALEYMGVRPTSKISDSKLLGGW